MSKFSLTNVYQQKSVTVTAHRGFSGRYPENTLRAFREAIKLGVDFIEFDLRSTRDGVPVLLHDETVDRTSNGTGAPEEYTLAELKKLNFSFWDGSHDGLGKGRLEQPAYPDSRIVTFEELLAEVGGQVGLNIQVYDSSEKALREICRLYRKFDLFDQGYLSLTTFADAELVRSIDAEVEISVLDRQAPWDRDFVKKCRDFGCRMLQPLCHWVTPESCRMYRELGMNANMFYSNTDENNRRFIACGIAGILTDLPDVLLATLKDLGLR